MAYISLAQMRRRNVRGPVNPMDKSTIISIYPRDIIEFKPTIQPGRFDIKSGTPDNPSFLVVGSSSWWKNVDIDQPDLEIPNGSIQVAKSVVDDYCNGILACDMVDAMPGLFFLPGEWNHVLLLEKHKNTLQNVIRKQKNWFIGLVQMADVLWSRSNANPLSITDEMRLAAKELALSNKDWMLDHVANEMVRCVACGALRNPNYPVCGSCHAVIDKKRAEELKLTFAQ